MNLYVLPRDLYFANLLLYHQDGTHYTDLDATHVIAKCHFRDAKHERIFSNQPGVRPLPHPARNIAMAALPVILAHLQNNPDLGVLPTDTVLDVYDKIGAHNLGLGMMV